MALPNYAPLVIQQGATFKFWFALRLANGTIQDPPAIGGGYTIGRLQVRDKVASDGGTLLLELTTANGGVSLGLVTDADGRQWSGFLYASASATAALLPWGDAVYDLEISDGLDVIRVLQGPCILSPEVTV